MQEKICQSCGMPMKEKTDFGGGDIDNKYCKYCTDEKGELKDFTTKLEETINFVATRMNVDKSVAKKIAQENMAKMPAWKEFFKS